jgi:hypothetical protein
MPSVVFREVCKEIFSFKECGDGDFVYVRRPKPHVDGKWLGTKGKWPKLGKNMQIWLGHVKTGYRRRWVIAVRARFSGAS